MARSPETLDPLLEASHIHRANQNRGSAASEAGLRMFRQGYDFFEGFADGSPSVGLNFVSFQRDLASFHHVLHLPGWLGDTNFGGPAKASADVATREPRHRLRGRPLRGTPIAEPFPGVSLRSSDHSGHVDHPIQGWGDGGAWPVGFVRASILTDT